MVRRVRRRGGRKPYRRVRKVFAAGYGRPRMGLRGLVPGVHRFKETCELVSWTAAATSNTYGVQAFQATNLTNWGNFQNMFDMYKITAIKLTIIPQFNTASVSEGTIGPNINLLPMLYIAPNRSPWSVAPTSVQDVLNDDGVRIIRLDRKVSFYLSNPAPQIIDGAGNGVPIQTNGLHRLWLTTGGNGQTVNQSSVQHYGFRYVLQNQFNTNGLGVQVFATYYFKCKEQD